MHRNATSLFRLLNLPAANRPLDLEALRFFGIKDDAAIETLVTAGMLRPTKPASQIMCSECDEIHEVIRSVRNRKVTFRYAGACGFDVVAAADLRQWSVEWKAIADWLASVLSGDSDDSKASTIVPDQAWQIGSVDIGGSSIAVVLVRRMETSQLASLVKPDRSVLLVPEPDIETTDDFAAEFHIADVFKVNDESIELDRSRIRSSVHLGDDLVSNQFVRLGEGWELRFAGTKVWMKDSFGLLYIARLLARPNTTVSALTLLATRMGIDEVAINGSTGEMIDVQARDAYRDRYEALMRDLPRARENNDHAWLSELEAEQQALTSELSSAFGKDGKARVKSDYENARKSVFMNITRAIKRISDHHAELGAHLDLTINTGGDCVYQERDTKDWIV